jgi:hypothetical protein
MDVAQSGDLWRKHKIFTPNLRNIQPGTPAGYFF